MEPISEVQLEHFHRRGFFLMSNLLEEEDMQWVDHLQQEVSDHWAATEWPATFNRLACQFFMVGEPLLRFVEDPRLLNVACRLLDCEKVHVGACGFGDASAVVSEDGRSRCQVHWHTDGGPATRQVSVRTALDRHGAANAPLRIIPGTHRRPSAEVELELMQLELASGCHKDMPSQCFVRHPEEVEVHLDPMWSLVWTPSCWHSTGVKEVPGPRRAMSWNYYPPGGLTRDRDALRHILDGKWQGWTGARRSLWGLDD